LNRTLILTFSLSKGEGKILIHYSEKLGEVVWLARNWQGEARQEGGTMVREKKAEDQAMRALERLIE